MGADQSAADQKHAQAVVVAVAEAAGDAAVELNEAVDGFGAAVGGAGGVEVGQELAAPLLEGPAEAGDLRDRAGRKAVDDLGREPPLAAGSGWW